MEFSATLRYSLLVLVCSFLSLRMWQATADPLTPLLKSALETYWQTNPTYINETLSIHCPRPMKRPSKQDLSEDVYKTYREVPEIKLEPFLAGDVHPIFNRSNWLSDLPGMDDAHKAMLPAFRLATELLACNETLSWLAHVKFGDIVRAPDTGRPYLRTSDRETDTDYVPIKHKIEQELLQWAKRIKFTWIDSKTTDEAMAMTAPLESFIFYQIGASIPDYRRSSFSSLLVSRTPEPILISLKVGLYCQLLAIHGEGLSQSEQLRFQFTLASLLLHELGHAWNLHHDELSREIEGVEPLYRDSDVVSELGYSLEVTLFGALLRCTDAWLIDDVNICIRSMTSTRLEDIFPVLVPITVLVPMWWVQQWFLRKTWVNINLSPLQAQTIKGHAAGFYLKQFRHGQLSGKDFVNNKWLALNGGFGDPPKDSPYPWNNTNLAEVLLPAWAKEAEEAFKDGKLPEYYYKQAGYSKRISRNYSGPVWAT